MNTQEGRAWISLAGIKGVGTKALWRIADYLTSRRQTAYWLLQNPELIKDALKGNKACGVPAVSVEPECDSMDSSADQPITLLHPLHPEFPNKIKELKDKASLPAILYTVGNRAILGMRSISIVGQRNAGKEAIELADSLATDLAAKGINITSGYASGIDSTAHIAALHSGGTTAIVLGEGINNFKAKPEFREYISEENTLVISQFEPRARWESYFAMARNKLVCALSNAVLVIISGPERDSSGRMSGTFDAGLSALKMEVPVFVVKPDYFPENPEGNQKLISKGGIEWDPLKGLLKIINAIDSPSSLKSCNQQCLFK
jgi:DNA processing protein